VRRSAQRSGGVLTKGLQPGTASSSTNLSRWVFLASVHMSQMTMLPRVLLSRMKVMMACCTFGFTWSAASTAWLDKSVRGSDV